MAATAREPALTALPAAASAAGKRSKASKHVAAGWALRGLRRVAGESFPWGLLDSDYGRKRIDGLRTRREHRSFDGH